MEPVILYRHCREWEQEEVAARKYFKCIKNRTLIQANQLIIPRFSALPFFKELEEDVNYLGSKLINNYSQHQYIADLGNWICDIKDTPLTWKDPWLVPANQAPFVLKGETNSKKFLWKTHMFAENIQQMNEIYGRLLQDGLIQDQKIYIRKYVPLEKLADGLQGLPVTREYRFFVYKTTILSGAFYWSSHSEELKEKGFALDPSEVDFQWLNNVIQQIQNTEICPPPDYYVIDVAKTQEGKWIVIELNDGAMSGLSDNDPEVLYRNLKEALL